jgi:hypothetical protein
MDADPVGLPLPRADQTVESTHRLVLDGVRFRIEHNDPGLRRQVPGEADGVTKYDGAMVYRRIYLEGRDRPSLLTFERPKETPQFGSAWLQPLSLWCRGTGSVPFGGLTRDTRKVDQVEYERQPYLAVGVGTPQVASTVYLLDRGREYLVRRITASSSAGVEETDVDYREQAGGGWALEGWTTIRKRADGKLAHRIRAEVTEVRVSEAIAPETFQLDLIPGEHVVDHRDNKSYQVRPDRGLEPLDRNGVPVVAPPEPSRPVPAWPGRPLVRYVLLPGLFVGVLAAVVVRRRRRPPNTPTP